MTEDGKKPKLTEKQEERLHQNRSHTYELETEKAINLDKLVNDVSIFCQRTLFFLHGGALIGVVAMYARQELSPALRDALAHSGTMFLAGVVSALLASAFNYLYITLASKFMWDSIPEIFHDYKEDKAMKKFRRYVRPLVWVYAAFGVTSSLFFIGGAYIILDALANRS